jgi:hypothetical protein
MEASLSYLEFHSLMRFLGGLLTTREQEETVGALGDGDEQRFHILRVLDKILLRYNVGQRTDGKVSSMLWT